MRFAVAGYGEMEKDFLRGGTYSNSSIEFLGKLFRSKVSETLKKLDFLFL